MSENIIFNYNCDKCDFHTNSHSAFTKHLLTGKHNTGHRSQRSDKKVLDKCPYCNYIPTGNLIMKQHILNMHETKEKRKDNFKYYCDFCDFGSFSQKIYNTHILTDKHKQMSTK
jgi:hypothetical protein